MSDVRRVRNQSDVPPHEPGSVHAYNRGCREHPECREAARKAKAKLREKYRVARVYIPQVLPDGTVENRWVSPALAPAHMTHIPARHGTPYGRREHKCDCEPCRQARRTHPNEEGTH